MPCIYLPSLRQKEGAVKITGENARYLLTVLRCRAGDELTLLDSLGGRYRAEIKEAGRRDLTVELKEAFPPEPEPPVGVVLLQGLLKGQKMDLVVQKATELGVREIVPVVTERAQVRQTRKPERWRKIALEASRQSGRTAAPSVREPVGFGEFLRAGDGLRGFLFWEEGGARLKEAFAPVSEGTVHIAVGPEGGFTAEEVRMGRDRGLAVTTLGRRILRAETAAIAAVALVQFLIGAEDAVG
jgi:16S rRNA (uracil1498-N3)-methyltransferase